MKPVTTFAAAKGRALAVPDLVEIWPIGIPALTISSAACDEQRASRYGAARGGVAARLLHLCCERDEERGAPIIISADTPAHRFSVVCKHCGRHIAHAARIRDPEIAVIEEHVRRCSGPAPLPDTPQLGDC